MGNKTYRDMGFRIDSGSTGTLTDIKAFLNQAELQRTIELIEDTGLADTNRSYLHGLAGTTVQISGMVNTTTDAIFGPLVNAATSVTKTVEYKSYTGRYYNGEVLISQVRFSGSNNTLHTFSANATFDGAVNRTSVALS